MAVVKWREVLAYRKDNRLLSATVIFTALAFAVYLLYFDILIPGLPDGSYRLAVGQWFAVPSLMLALGQALIFGFFLHMTVSAFTRRSDFLKAVFVSSFLTFLFSLTYIIFPSYGPFYFIVFAVGGPWHALPVEILWSAVIVTAGAFLIRGFYGLPLKVSLFASALVVAGITVAAS